MTTNRLRYEGIAKPFWANGKPLGEPLNHWVSDWFMTGSLWLVTGSSTKNQGLGWSPAAQLDGTEILILWLLLGIHDLWWKACHPPRFVEFSTCPEWCSHCCLRETINTRHGRISAVRFGVERAKGFHEFKDAWGISWMMNQIMSKK